MYGTWARSAASTFSRVTGGRCARSRSWAGRRCVGLIVLTGDGNDHVNIAGNFERPGLIDGGAPAAIGNLRAWY